ncbi:juvenile hormone esterase-like [Aphomia sociella]
MSNLIVEVEQGKLQGTLSADKQFNIFRGVPYAKPPVGELRFKIPSPPEPWVGVRDAKKTCNICVQYDRVNSTFVGSEDCLYLNVYTPIVSESDLSLLPVMVFFHGGGFVYGNGTNDMEHGMDYIVKKNVIVVSLNYRLGVLGFLCLDSKDAPGNMGLRDQVEALRWIQKNINQFGGDPNNVTIFGVSAGGVSVEYLLISPIAKGLFHKGIAQSGSSLLPWALNCEVRELSKKILDLKGKTVKNGDELLRYLKEMPIEELVKTSLAAIEIERHDGGINFGFVPTIEKPTDWEPFLDKSTFDLLLSGKFNKVPFITGFCSREGLLMLPFRKERLDKLMKDKNFVEYLQQFFGIDNDNTEEVAFNLKNVYLNENKKYDDVDEYGINFFTDIDFAGGIIEAASLIAKHNSPVYFYEFCYDGHLNYLKKKLNIERKGACHADDVGYLLKCMLDESTVSKVDELVRDRMITLWTNFAKYGKPTPEVNDVITTEWKPIDDTAMFYLSIDYDLTMKKNLYPERTKLFKNLFEKYYRNKKF